MELEHIDASQSLEDLLRASTGVNSFSHEEAMFCDDPQSRHLARSGDYLPNVGVGNYLNR